MRSSESACIFMYLENCIQRSMRNILYDFVDSRESVKRYKTSEEMLLTTFDPQGSFEENEEKKLICCQHM